MGLVDKLQELLDEHQLTQKEAAQRLNISPNTLNGYVRGNREPDLNMLTKIADLFEVSADYLLDHHPSHSFCTADYDYYIRLLLKEARVMSDDQLKLLIRQARLINDYQIIRKGGTEPEGTDSPEEFTAKKEKKVCF